MLMILIILLVHGFILFMTDSPLLLITSIGHISVISYIIMQTTDYRVLFTYIILSTISFLYFIFYNLSPYSIYRSITYLIIALAIKLTFLPFVKSLLPVYSNLMKGIFFNVYTISKIIYITLLRRINTLSSILESYIISSIPFTQALGYTIYKLLTLIIVSGIAYISLLLLSFISNCYSDYLFLIIFTYAIIIRIFTLFYLNQQKVSMVDIVETQMFNIGLPPLPSFIFKITILFVLFTHLGTSTLVIISTVLIVGSYIYVTQLVILYPSLFRSNTSYYLFFLTIIPIIISLYLYL